MDSAIDIAFALVTQRRRRVEKVAQGSEPWVKADRLKCLVHVTTPQRRDGEGSYV